MLLTAVVALLLVGWDDLKALVPRRRNDAVDETSLVGAITAELQTGASIRRAIAEATSAGDSGSIRLAHRLAVAGAPIEAIAEPLETLPRNGRRIGAAVRVAGIAGGRSAEVFARLLARAAQEEDLRRERRALTAQVRLSAVVVSGLPILSLLFGGIDRIRLLLGSGPAGAAMALAGFGMQLAGGLIAARMAVRR